MSKTEKVFRAGVRFVFLTAYAAFLYASIRHIAFYFKRFENTDANWTSSYALAASIDVTQLVLTIGVMFFRKNMSKGAFFLVCFFIVFLTGFSWLVNWEYASYFQSTYLTHDPILVMLNPILASSFAFLNLAYSIVAEAFNTQPKTALELAKEADRLEALETEQNRIDAYNERHRRPGLIQRTKETIIEIKQASEEILTTEQSEPDTEKSNTNEQGNETEIDQEKRQIPNTDELPQVKKPNTSRPRSIRSVRKTKRARGESLTLVRQVLQSNPKATLSEIVKQTGISRGHVSTLRNQILDEQPISVAQ